MSDTRLTFHVPPDLSAGRVILQDASGAIHELLATPGQRILNVPTAEPGVWTAHIAPIGQAARPFVFEVEAGQPNSVSTPLFSALVAGGPETMFASSAERERILAALQRTTRSHAIEPNTVEEERFASVKTASGSRLLTIGVSQATGPEGWIACQGAAPELELEDAGVNVLFRGADTPSIPPRLRLSIALQYVRVERLLVPLFRGGVRVAVRPSPLTTRDVEVTVSPLDLERRALLNALGASEADQAAAVFHDVLRGGIDRFVAGPDEDPWAAIVAALLTLRFPSILAGRQPAWGSLLASRYPWACDAHIVNARNRLTAIGEAVEERRQAAAAALDDLTRAQAIGAPYFAYANQLLGELLTGLAALDPLDPALADSARRQLDKWAADRPLQGRAGAVFSWQMNDPRQAREGGAQPFRPADGQLDRNEHSIVFHGRADLSKITVRPSDEDDNSPTKRSIPSRPQETSLAEPIDRLGASRVSDLGQRPDLMRSGPPGLQMPVIFPDDPNKGRFGEQARRDGHEVSVAFGSVKGNWVTIHLAVTADESVESSWSDAVEFYLHPSFSPSRLTATFKGRVAELTVRAWGGFTVGVWIPARGVALELDLAQAPGAPRAIREY
jgi:hypothetical protein